MTFAPFWALSTAIPNVKKFFQRPRFRLFSVTSLSLKQPSKHCLCGISGAWRLFSLLPTSGRYLKLAEIVEREEPA
jgi:hypothetical protein